MFFFYKKSYYLELRIIISIYTYTGGVYTFNNTTVFDLDDCNKKLAYFTFNKHCVNLCGKPVVFNNL